MKYTFAFELGERVTVPHSPIVQGIVVAASASINTENKYVVTAMTDEGMSGTVTYSESILIGAQPKARETAKAKR